MIWYEVQQNRAGTVILLPRMHHSSGSGPQNIDQFVTTDEGRSALQKCNATGSFYIICWWCVQFNKC